jgi:hypothetical protein
MGLFSRRKRTVEPVPVPVPIAEQQQVMTHLKLSDQQFGTAEERERVFELEARIVSAVAAIGCDHDGNEFGGGEAVLFTYGPDADALLDVIRESLKGFDVLPGSYAIKRYGGVHERDAAEARVELA